MIFRGYNEGKFGIRVSYGFYDNLVFIYLIFYSVYSDMYIFIVIVLILLELYCSNYINIL